MTGTYDEYIYFIISYDMLRFHQHLLFGSNKHAPLHIRTPGNVSC